MRTSEEIYHRVRWDPRFDPARFVLGVNVRGAEPKRVPLAAFVPGGDIPWHRVLFVEADGEIVWDRSTGVDRFDSSPAGRVDAPRRLRAPFFTATTPHAWHEVDGWVPVLARPTPPPARLRVLTWNTLWDRYDSDRIDTARRRPLLLAALRRADADVIALQEVQRGLLTQLLAAGWVRDDYTVAADPAGDEVDDSGVLLLSRLPVREAGRHVLGPYKAVTAITVECPTGPAVVATVHLTSDHTQDGADRRAAELARLAHGLSAVDGAVVVVGDFNDGGDTPSRVLGLRDAWTEVRGPEDRTVTFDPVGNPLAAVSSRTGRASRLDRVLLRHGGLRATGARLIGDAPVDGLFPSDHYGVLVDLAVGPAVTGGVRPGVTGGVRPAVTGGMGPLPAGRTDVAGTPAALAAGMGNSVAAGVEGSVAAGAADGVAADRVAAGVVDGVAAALAGGVVHVVGSRRLGCALPGADLDLVAALPGAVDPADVRARVAAALPQASAVRPVVGARVPGLRLRVDGLDVDLVLVGSGAVPPPAALARRAELGEAVAIALSAVTDARAIVDAVGAEPAFPVLARAVKAWARDRGLDSAAFGGLPGLAWAVLAARTVREAADLPPTGLLRHFFGTWAAWDWRVPVALTTTADPVAVPVSAATPPGPAPLTILTPSYPVRSCTGQVSSGMSDLVTQELYQAWEGREPTPVQVRHRGWAVLTVRAVRGETFEATVGRFRGRVRALLSAIQDSGAADAHAWPRPFESGPELRRYAIGLGREPYDAT
ncbi:MAG TPA: poly(A) polymerase, partial [Catenuloplanes sp.]